MKLLPALLALVVWFSACAKTENTEITFSTTKAELIVSADGGLDTIFISSPLIWSARSSAHWVTIVADSLYPKGELRINTSASNIESERSAEILIFSGAETFKIPVTQEPFVHPAFRNPDLGPLVISSGSETFDTLINQENLMIARIKSCGEEPESNSHNIVLLNEKSSKVIANWNHINSQTGEWAGINRSPSNYLVPNHANSTDDDCNEAKTLNTILVKKYGDWDHQHSNGFIVAPGPETYVAGTEKIIIDLYYDSEQTHIPTSAELTAAYGISGNALLEWDKSLFNLDIQIHTRENTHLAHNLELSPDFADQWLRIEIPLDQMKGWNSEKKVIRYDQILRHLITEISFTAETSNRLVYRNLNMSGFSDSTPKLFKELEIRIKRIELVRNKFD